MHRHRLNLVSLLFGVFFVVIGLIGLLDLSGITLSLRWIWPLAVILTGVALLARVIRRPGDDDDEIA